MSGYLAGDPLIANMAPQSFTGNGSQTTFTLPWKLGASFAAIVHIGGVYQFTPSSYSISGYTLTTTSPVPDGVEMVVTPLARECELGTPSDGTVTPQKNSGNAPKITRYTSGSGNHNCQSYCKLAVARFVGGGGGGGGNTGTGGTGGDTSFNSVVAKGGSGGPTGTGTGVGGAGGTGGTGSATYRMNGATGNPGGPAVVSINSMGGVGGGTRYGGGGAASRGPVAGGDAASNTGAGGGGAGAGSNGYGTAGGGAGEYCEVEITNPSGPYAYSIGSGGTAGTGSGSATGGVGGSGFLEVIEYF